MPNILPITENFIRAYLTEAIYDIETLLFIARNKYKYAKNANQKDYYEKIYCDLLEVKALKALSFYFRKRR